MLLVAVLPVMVAGQPSCEPLSAIYNAMGGPGWKNKANQAGGRSWIDPSVPCCEKEFVTCKGDKGVKKIAWKAIKGLKGTIPRQLGLLTRLEEIVLSRTEVSGTLPAALVSAASHIEKLELERSSLSGTLPNSFFSDSSRITTVKIKRSYISGTLPPSLFLSGTLKEMDAKEAGLSGTIPPSIGRANKLKELKLSESINCVRGTKNWKRKHCKGLSGTIPPEIGRATQLEERHQELEEEALQRPLGHHPARDREGDPARGAPPSPQPLLGQPAGLAALLRELEELELYDNELSGTIPRGLHVSKDCELVDADPPPSPHPPGKAPEPPNFGRMLDEAWLGGSAPLDAAVEEGGEWGGG
eukprot:CAMPEP_0185401342 /NCGR_PEP_ID=MMETSP1364-20130426/91247_1 /TAXON_ID=38817 /ORGANISM="Gephyrocapsa oceanica, Strain RCC1303" /LENGTH=356 /DNA_ID=CAMNT_0028003639 /DNA_START=47 /DNA_END=1115 /DNA_ORIENTATION=+